MAHGLSSVRVSFVFQWVLLYQHIPLGNRSYISKEHAKISGKRSEHVFLFKGV